jgi:hypothetical protein
MCGCYVSFEVPECSVCLNEITRLRELYVLSCGHIFCKQCLTGISKSFIKINIVKCPKCQSHKTCVPCKDFDYKCTLCKNHLFFLHEHDQTIVHLNCGHFYCYECVFRISNCVESICRRCPYKHNVNPVYF